MKMRKQALLIPLLILTLFVSACGKRDLPTDKPLDDGSFFYRNEMHSFSLILPPAFEFYQTQRVEGQGYTDIEFYVPTSDTRFGSQIPGYAQPIVIRVFEKAVWEEVNQGSSEYKLIAEKGDKVFTIQYWETEPKDWQAKWSDENEKAIVDSFKAE
jgi:hypothetical protein